MIACKRCRSCAINHHLHGRDGTGLELCDVCFWRAKYEATLWQPIATVDVTKIVSIYSKLGGVDDNAYFHKPNGCWMNGFDNVIVEPILWRERVMP